MYDWSVIHGIKRKPHLSVVWNWYHFVAIAILHQPRPTDSADINTRLQLSDTSSIPPMHGGFLLEAAGGEWHPSDQGCTFLGCSTISAHRTHPSSAGNESDIQEGPHHPIQAPESTTPEIGI